MKFKALVTSLLLSSSSIALADNSFAARSDDDVVALRDHRGNRTERWRQPTWTPISETITAAHRNVIRLDERQDDLGAIRLQNGSGATYVYSITLRFEDGTRENIEVGKWLYAGVPLLTFDLPQDRGGLDRIVVNTWTSVHSTYQVHGQLAGRYYPAPRPPAPPPPVSSGISIGKDLSFDTTRGYVHVPVGADKGNFHKLRIESTIAGTFIGRIHVTFPSGQQQTFEIDKPLQRGEKLDLDLEGTAARPIAAVTVTAPTNIRTFAPSPSRFNLTLL